MQDEKDMNIFNTYDDVLVILSLLLVFILMCLLFLPYSDTLTVVGDYSVMLTHLFALPSVYLTINTRWLFALLFVTAAISLTYHAVVIADYDKATDLKFELADEAAQSVLIWTSTLIFVFNDMPFLGIPFLMVVGIVVAIFGDTQLFSTDVDHIVNGLAIVSVLLFITYKLFVAKCNFQTNFFRYKRIWEFILIGLGYFILAFGFYFLGGQMVNYEGEKQRINYNLLHSGWHICAYTALFFIFRSRVKPLKTLMSTVRIKRTSFAVKHRSQF
tara:strand:- start:5582 stop:6397 length:816 start_codon:yes stop_codon:yes gene_type:complete